jgi:Ser/Thr protein kinase RdoA (MazF antagonist)
VPTNVERADLLGAALGQLHAAADSFAARTERRPRELGSCLDAALAGLSELPYRSREVQDSVHSLASRVRARLAGLDAKALDFGPIHGDPFSNNAVLDASGRVRWYDFDECAPAHRAWDLSVPFWLSKTRSDASLFQRFVGAYRAQRPLEERELAALPWLLVASLIRTLVQIPRERGAILGREIAEQTVSARLEQLRGAAAWLVD